MEKIKGDLGYVYGFTKKEAIEIRDILKAYEAPSVVAFLMEAEGICTQQMSIAKAPLTRPETDVQKKKMIVHFDKAKEDINVLLGYVKYSIPSKESDRHEIKLIPTERVDEWPLGDMEDVELYELYRQRLLTAFYALQDIKTFLDASIIKGKHGRPSADQTGFVRSIAECYRKHIDTPTTYRDGPFFLTIQSILKAVGLPDKDPSRAIKAALK